jgi:hypothetical protein
MADFASGFTKLLEARTTGARQTAQNATVNKHRLNRENICRIP